MVAQRIDRFLGYESIYIGLRGGDIHTMSLAATKGTGARAEALRCTERADGVCNASYILHRPFHFGV